MDAFSLLEQDHRTVEKLFARFEKAQTHAQRKSVVQALVRELSIHAVVEEQVMYPALRRRREAFEDLVLESLEEHNIVKWTLAALDKMKPTDERYEAKVTVLKEMVAHHVEEEEEEVFPKARKAFTQEEINRLGETIEALKKVAPTRPHPRAPDAPPGNIVSGAMASVLDRSRDFLSGRHARPTPRAAAKTVRRKAARKARSQRR
jgi:hemerythrin superfamily protein